KEGQPPAAPPLSSLQSLRQCGDDRVATTSGARALDADDIEREEMSARVGGDREGDAAGVDRYWLPTDNLDLRRRAVDLEDRRERTVTVVEWRRARCYPGLRELNRLTGRGIREHRRRTPSHDLRTVCLLKENAAGGVHDSDVDP